MENPFVSIIILNFNGASFLPACLNALSNQTYPSDRTEVIVSDNGSSDGSLKLLKDEYPWVNVIENGKNLGFAQGNNVAMKEASGEYLVLLNNDTAPDEDWLRNIVKVSEENPDAGIVTGRLQLFYDQLMLTIESETFVPQNDGRDLGVMIAGVDSGAPGGEIQYLNGFYGWEQFPSGNRFRWTSGEGQLGVPVPNGAEEWGLKLELAAYRPENQAFLVKIKSGDHVLAERQFSGETITNWQVNIPVHVSANAKPLVQNTGSLIFWDGSGRDRGTYVRNFEVFYETDNNQFGEVEEVFAGCGASMLLRRSMLDDIGMLDDDFFLYYEDTDLSWRARLAGWKVLYAPSAIVRHIHCGTSGEWSPLFLFYVQRNRLAMLLKNGTTLQVLSSWIKFLGSATRDSIAMLSAYLRRTPGRTEAWERLRIRYSVIGSLLKWLPDLLRKRYSIQGSRRVSHRDLEPWFIRQEKT